MADQSFDEKDPRAIPAELAQVFDRLASIFAAGGPRIDERDELEELMRRCGTQMRAWADFGMWPNGAGTAAEEALPAGDDMTVAGIMRFTGWGRPESLAAFKAMDEGQRVFNAAKKIDAQSITLSRRALYVLFVLAGSFVGMEQIGPRNLS